MFDTLIVEPIFNLLVLIYALIPGHNFGLAIILFTILIRLLLWPLIKKQLHQTKLMRRIQPDLKRIAEQTKGNRQQQALLQMELYKERGINPFRSIGIMFIQLPILLALYFALRNVINNTEYILEATYAPIRSLPWMQTLADNLGRFDISLFGLVDLHRVAIGPGGLYIPALLIVIASVVVQYYQAKQLMPQDKEARSLRAIFKDANDGKQADQAEISAAVGRFTLYLLPGMIFIFTVGLASALSLYWFVSGLVALIQQTIVLREDQEEMQALTDAPSKKNVAAIPEAEVVESSSQNPRNKKPAKSSKGTKKKRRK